MNLDHLPMSRKQVLSIAASFQSRITLTSGAVRSGKTIGSLVAFLIHLSRAPQSGLILACGRTLQTIERNILEPMQDPALFGPIAEHVHHTRGAPTATVLGRTVHLIGASDARAEGRIRGLTASLVLVDEATLVPESFFSQLLARMSVPGAKILVTTNPDGPGHWLRKNFILRAGELDLAHFHFTLDDNHTLSPEYVAAIKAENVGVFYRRFVLGEWCMAEGAIYDAWDADKHVIDEVPPIWRWLGVGIDYGTANAFSALLVGMDASQTLYVASEFRYDSKLTRRQLTDVEYSQRLRTWLTEQKVQPESVIVDPSAASFMQQLQRDGISPTPADNAVLDGIRTVSALMAAGKLKVHRSCKALLEELPAYSWDPKLAKQGVDAPLKVADHSADALRYLVLSTQGTWRRPNGIQYPHTMSLSPGEVDLMSAAM